MTTYIKRAYWAANGIHNKVFFNQASKIIPTPDREDEIVAMLTEQDALEVALLRITREIIKKAEEEQPDKKINITKQDKNVIIIEEPIKQTQDKQEEVHQQSMETNRNQEEKVSLTNNNRENEILVIQEKDTEAQKEEQKQEAIEIEVEKEIDIVGEPLEESI